MPAESMTSKERIVCAMKGGKPDRVPVQLGILSIAPTFSKSTFWDVYYYNKVDIQNLMVEIVNFFDFDGYLYSHVGRRSRDNQCESTKEVVSQDDEFIVVRNTLKTPKGDLWWEQTFPRTETPTLTRGSIKSEEDFKIFLEYCLPDPTKSEWDSSPIARDKKRLGDKGAVAATMTSLPGLHDLTNIFDGRLEKATYFMMDHPELIEEYRERQERILLAQLECALEAKPDYVEFSNSGMLTLSNRIYSAGCTCQRAMNHRMDGIQALTWQCDRTMPLEA